MVSRTVTFTFLAILHLNVKGEEGKCEHGDWGFASECKEGAEIKGPREWVATYPKCALPLQSPINIRNCGVTSRASVETAFDIEEEIEWTNTGHSIKAVLGNADGETGYMLTNSNKQRPHNIRSKDTFKLAQFHMHWRKNLDDKGSEHSINGRFYPLEAHFVTYNSRYDSFDDAVKDTKSKDAISVIGVMFDLSDDDHPGINQMIKVLNATAESKEEKPEGNKVFKDDKYALKNVDPCTFLPNGTCGVLPNFAYYSGGFTTPPCNAGTVVWIIATDTSFMSRRQLNFLQSNIYSTCEGSVEEELISKLGNARPIQCTEGRQIFHVRADPPANRNSRIRPCPRITSPCSMPNASLPLDCTEPFTIEKKERVMIAGISAIGVWGVVAIVYTLYKIKKTSTNSLQFSNPGFQSGDIQVGGDIQAE